MKALRRSGSFWGAAIQKKVGEFVTEAVAEEVVLTVNGDQRRVPAGWSLADLLESLNLDARTVVIERNGTILRDRSSFASVELVADDSLEIVHFVGGG